MSTIITEFLNRHKVMFYDKARTLQIKCINPEHDDNSPSLYIDKNTGLFNCFACGFKGNFNTLKKLFGETIENTSDSLSLKLQLLEKELNALYVDSTKLDLQWPSNTLWDRDYRGVLQEISNRYQLFTSNEEEFQARVWMPIIVNGKTVLFQGRAIVENLKPKYMFKPDYQSNKHLVYDLTKIPNKSVVLVEGMFDMLCLQSAGIKESCCIFGSNFNLEKLNTLLSHNVEVVITMFDGDDAGRKAALNTKHIIEKNASHILCINVPLKEGDDPGILNDRQVDRYLKHITLLEKYK